MVTTFWVEGPSRDDTRGRSTLERPQRCLESIETSIAGWPPAASVSDDVQLVPHATASGPPHPTRSSQPHKKQKSRHQHRTGQPTHTPPHARSPSRGHECVPSPSTARTTPT